MKVEILTQTNNNTPHLAPLCGCFPFPHKPYFLRVKSFLISTAHCPRRSLCDIFFRFKWRTRAFQFEELRIVYPRVPFSITEEL